MNESFEQCLSMQSGKNKRQRSPISVKFATQRSFQVTKQTRSDYEQQRLVLDYSRQGLTSFKDGIMWNGLLHLILNENRLKEFDTNILKKTPLLQHLSLEDNQLQTFGPIECGDAPKLSTLNIARNLLKQIDPSICKLQLKKLYIQQNYFTNITKQIVDLSYTLEVLGLGWGIFCQSQFDFLLEDQKLKVFFTLVEAMSNELTFEQYIMNYKSISNAVIVTQGDILNDSINSQNEQLLTQIKESLNYHSLEIETQLNYMNDYKQNLMHLAVVYDEIGILDYLLNHHLNLANQIDLKGHTPLSLAIEKKYYRLVSLILKFNVNVNLGGGLQSSNLHIVAQQCQVELLQDLIDLGANPAQYDIFKDTPLHIISSQGDHKRVKQFYQVLLQQPFDVNHQNLKGQSCLEILIEKNNFLTLQFCSEWNTSQIRQFNDQNLFNFCSINPHTQLSLLDKSIITKSLMIQQFLVDFQLVPITYQTLMLCFLPKIRNVFLYKILKKQQQIQIRNSLILSDGDLNEERDGILKVSPRVEAIEKLSVSEENSSFDDDQMSNISDNAPGLVSENLKQLNSWTPKFQSLRNGTVNFKKSFYDILSNLTECIPDDEISLIHYNKDIINNNGSKLVTKKNMDEIYTSRLEHKLTRGNRQNLKQHNYSPNNIRMIENRNSIFKYDNYQQKRQLAILQKQMRQIIISLQNHLRESNQQNEEVIGEYFRTQFKILDQFLTSKIGKELITIDKPLQTEIRTLRTLIQQDRFKTKIINKVIDLFDLLK
ncbi:unnamed protein product [Paramecium octaurelia]|uniref:Uncharacterized protein n=1 Tax=Paramecium octaurelia TaxID=43137 RepID=A0A8S1VDT6_PAROT|nr:unnamed protein product [Paramecium octaurelia]